MTKLNISLVACAMLCMAMTCHNNDLTKNYDLEELKPVSEGEWAKEFTKVEAFNPADFDENSIIIDNPWLPMIPGTDQIYKGVDVDEDGEEKAHTVMSAATDLTKVINGVRCVVLFERDYCEGQVEEKELAFFAQDKYGNVWHFGQYVEHYEDDGFFSGGRMWCAGSVDGAYAGIMMVADPKVGSPGWSVGYAPAPFNWADRSQVHEMGKKVTTKMGDYENVLMVRESSHEEPNAYQLKYYAKGIGNFGIGWIGDDPNKETMDLVETRELDEKAMAELRDEAMGLERRAAVYGQLQPAVQVTQPLVSKNQDKSK